MVKVRTIRDHYNGHGDSYFKSGSAGPVYEVADDGEAQMLINLGYVEAADDGNDVSEHRGRRANAAKSS